MPVWRAHLALWWQTKGEVSAMKEEERQPRDRAEEVRQDPQPPEQQAGGKRAVTAETSRRVLENLRMKGF